MPPAVVKLENLEKQFREAKRPALADLSASIRPGIITGLVGPDGAGKTTLMRLIAGLLMPTSGRVLVGGQEGIFLAAGMPSLREFIGYMPQKFGLYEDLSVEENLELHADLRGGLGL